MTKEENFYRVMIDFINERLDIQLYLKYLDILDRFRWIMLNHEQNVSLDYVKPINIADEDEYNTFLRSREQMKLSYQIFTYFIKKINNGTMTEIDNKIFSIIDPKIKKTLNSAD